MMNIVRFNSDTDIGRVPLARGDDGNELRFVISILVDGSGVVMEFEDGAYLLSTGELIEEILAFRKEEK